MGGRKFTSEKKTKASKCLTSENKDESESEPSTRNKPKFDKKKWRERKYSKKFKVAQWEEKRKKAVIRQYYKELQKDPLYSDKLLSSTSEDTGQAYSSGDTNPNLTPSFNKTGRKKQNSYQAVYSEMRRLKEEGQRKKEERLQRKQDIKAHLEEYRKKRAENYKILSKKNYKGQPVLKGRLEILYGKIKQDLPS